MERNSDKLYDEYREYVIKELGHFRPVEKAQFGSGLGKIIRVEITRKRYGDGRKKFYQFPSLADCRKDMERLAKMDIPWSFPLEEVDDVFAEVVADAVAVIPVAVKAIEESCDDDFSFTDEELMEFLDSCDVQQFEDDDDSLVWGAMARKPRFGKGRYSFGHNLEIE